MSEYDEEEEELLATIYMVSETEVEKDHFYDTMEQHHMLYGSAITKSTGNPDGSMTIELLDPSVLSGSKGQIIN